MKPNVISSIIVRSSIAAIMPAILINNLLSRKKDSANHEFYKNFLKFSLHSFKLGKYEYPPSKKSKQVY